MFVVQGGGGLIIKSVSVICDSSTGSYVIDMKNLVATKLYSFDQTSVYLKAVGFLLITFLERKSFLKIVYTCDRLCPGMFCLSIIDYQVNLVNLLLSLIRKA